MSIRVNRQHLIEKFQLFFEPSSIEEIKKLADSNGYEYTEWSAHENTQQGFSISRENFGLHIFAPKKGQDANIGFHQNEGEPKWATGKGAQPQTNCQFANGQLHINVKKAGPTLFLWKDVGSLKSISQLLERAEQINSQMFYLLY